MQVASDMSLNVEGRLNDLIWILLGKVYMTYKDHKLTEEEPDSLKYLLSLMPLPSFMFKRRSSWTLKLFGSGFVWLYPKSA